MSKCPCGSEKPYDKCCGPYISGTAQPPTAEALMRSRYSAYVKHEIDYIETSHSRETREQFDRKVAKAWSEQTEWQGLEIKATEAGQENDAEGTVEFIARFKTAVPGHGPDAQSKEVEQTHHELSYFGREDGRWVYVDGKTVRIPVQRAAPKLGRNDPCSCGSGKKFKKCCSA